MQSLIQQVNLQLSELLAKGHCHLCVAYSGGVDSQVLLHLVAELKTQWPQHQYSAVHINHGLSANADRWQAHCERSCTALQIPILTTKLNLQVGSRESLEAVAREQRYLKIAELVPRDATVLLAQHQDDQFETLLLQLKRGAGPKGLSSMAADTHKHGLRFVRPLLTSTKAQILEYANQNGLQWEEDESNQDCSFDRNFLRQQIIPKLTARWPSIPATASRSAFLCAEQTALLEECTEERLAKLQVQDDQLDINLLRQYQDGWRNQIVRLWLAKQYIPLPSQRILDEIPKLMSAADDANPSIRWSGWQLRRFQQCLYVLASQPEKLDFELHWLGREHWPLPNGLGTLKLMLNKADGALDVRLPKDAALTIRFGQLTDKFKPCGETMSKPVKQWLKLWKVPPWERGRIPMLYVNDKLFAMLMQERIETAAMADDWETNYWLSFEPDGN